MTGAKKIVINASWGLGEAVVSGEVTPDAYTVNKETLKEEQSKIGVKKMMTVTESQERGSRWLTFLRKDVHDRALAHGEVTELARIGREIEQHFDLPQDIEWGLIEDRFVVFQSRPITTLDQGIPSSFFTEASPSDTSLWTSGFFNERFPQPVSPLGWSLIKELVEAFAFKEPLKFVGFKRFEDLRATNCIWDIHL